MRPWLARGAFGPCSSCLSSPRCSFWLKAGNWAVFFWAGRDGCLLTVRRSRTTFRVQAIRIGGFALEL